MCLIIYKKAGITDIHSSIVEEAYSSNNDGFGLMLPDGNGHIKTFKTIGGLQEIKDIISDNNVQNKDLPVAYHFRFATHGLKDIHNVHPFKVLDKDIHGTDLYLMHNGIFSSIKSWDNKMSDTWHFVFGWFAPIVRNDPTVVQKEWFKKYVEHCIGSGNKLFTMDGYGNVQIFNEKTGVWTFEDLWLSNSFYTFSHERFYRDNPNINKSRFGRRVSRMYAGYDWDNYDDSYSNGYGSFWRHQDNTKDDAYCKQITYSSKTNKVVIPFKNNNDNIKTAVNTIEHEVEDDQKEIIDYSIWTTITNTDLFNMELEDLLQCMEENPGIVAEWIVSALYGK